MKKSHILKFSFAITLFLSFALNAQITNRIYTLGNSVTDGINFSGFEAIANQRGNTHQFARHMIPGTPLFLLYNSTTNGFSESPYGYWNNAFASYDWDCISFQPFDRDIMGSEGDFTTIEKWINYIKTNRNSTAQLQTYIYSRYPRAPQGKTYLTATNADWENLWLGTYGLGGQAQEEKRYFIDLLHTVRGANLLAKPIAIIPVGDVMHELNKKMALGRVSTITSAWGLYSDGIHVNNIGSFALASTFFATMYKQDPRGLIVPSQYGSIPDAIRDTILQTVYQVVFNHPFSGTSLLDIIPPTSVTVSPKNNSLSFLQSVKLLPVVSPSNASNKNMSWTSSNTSIASVDSKGKVIGVGSGIATITGTTNIGSFSDFVVVTVSGLSNFTSVTGILSGWDFENNPFTASGMNATFIANGITSVSGASYSQIGSGMSPRGDNFASRSLMATDHNNIDLASAMAANEYFSFKIKPAVGKLININKVSYRPNSQEDGYTYILMSSLKGFNAAQILSTFTGSSNSLFHTTITGHENISSEVEFRLIITGDPLKVGQYSFVALGPISGNDIQIEGDIITPVDTEKPTSVTGIAVSNIRENSFFLSWNEASDNMIVAGYNVYNNGIKLNAELIESTSFAATGLTGGLICNLTVTSVDYVGNESEPALFQTTTNSKPTAVLDISTTSGVTPLTITVSGINSTDPDISNGDYVLGYDFNFGDGSPIVNANSAIHTYSTTGVYRMSLVVVDTRNARSETKYQTIFVGVTPDLIPPSTPNNIVSSNIQSNQFDLAWSATDNVSVAGYTLSVNGILIGNTSLPSYRFTALTVNSTYNIAISAYDAAWNYSPIATTSATTVDTDAPSETSNLETTTITQNSFNLTWSASSDNVSVAGYALSINGVSVGNTTATSYNFTGLTQGTRYTVSVYAYDSRSNKSAISDFSLTTNDSQSPTAVSNLATTTILQSKINISWTASTDNITVLGYSLSINGVSVGNTSATSFDFTNLLAQTNYTISAQAFDASGNKSSVTNIITKTIDTEVPTLPSNLIFDKIAQNEIILSWTSSTDNVSLAGYALSVNGVSVSTLTSNLNYTFMGLNPNTSYTIDIQAIDASGNRSASVSITTTTSEIVVTKLKNITIADVFVYPNPVKGQEVYITKSADGIIYDLLGNKLIEFKNETVIDVSKLKSGIYFVKFNTGKITKLIVE